MTSGREWVVDASGCDPATLSSLAHLQSLFEDIIAIMGLHPVAPTLWRHFPGPTPDTPGGITGLTLLAESHLAVHTFPEHGTLCLNLFCCRPRQACDFQGELTLRFSAKQVTVRELDRSLA